MYIITYNKEEVEVDSFFEALTYRFIADIKNIDCIERSILLFVARKTGGFQKLYDTLGREYIADQLAIGVATLDRKMKQLIEKKYIYKVSSKGGATINAKDKYSKFRLGDNIIIDVLENWLDIKENNGFRY